MPKIIIREYDNTQAGVGLYANFAVLVPGYCRAREYDESSQAFMYGGKTTYKTAKATDEDKGEWIWDENGVHEFTSQAEFVKLVGKRAAKSGIVQEAVAPTVPAENVKTTGTGAGEVAQDEFLEYVYRGVAYNIETREEPDLTKIGKYDDGTHTYELMPSDTQWSAGITFAVIEDKDLGKDYLSGEQYGNQIAYELLGLGYTVLYKVIATKDEVETGKPVNWNEAELSILSESSFWNELKDKSAYDFRYVLNGLLENNYNANTAIADLTSYLNSSPETSGRGDCVALLDVDKQAYEGKAQSEAISGIRTEVAEHSFIDDGKYAAFFAPYVVYNMKYDALYENSTFPASFHYLACAAKAAEYYNEWYAIAGYARGISNYSLAAVGCKFGETAINALEPRYITNGLNRAVNLIVNIKGVHYLWGNRTACLLGTKDTDDGDLKASHFLNIRQLCTSIKKQVYITCRRRTFDPNSDLLWINFCNEIRPLLEKMKADQGITDYKFVKIKSTQKAMLKAKIRIVPIEAVEDFDISLTLEDSIQGITAEIEEE